VHSGKYWNFEIPMLRPRPYTKPYPQILRSAASEASLATQARLGRPVLMAAATSPGAARNIEIYRTAARDAGLSASQIDHAIAQSWVARTVVLAPTDQEAREVGLRITSKCRPTAQPEHRLREMVAKTRASGRLPVLCGSPDSMLEDFTISPRPVSAACSCASEPVRCRRNSPRGR